MHYFDCDYLEGAHDLILQRLIDINMEKNTGYGLDPYSISAKEKIRKACNCPDAEVHFMVGGTQTNSTVIKAVLRLYEGVISANSGHINTHEAGAIEAGGHKVLTLPHKNGKISAGDVKKYLSTFENDDNRSHMVKPGMVYISHPTEYGDLYTKSELENLSAVCREYGIPLYLDGARLGYALVAEGTDVTLEVIAKNCDIFYIGGTKVGAFFGEAVVITRPNLIYNFYTIIKQQGALLAKGWLLGIQFDTLFTDNLYYTISKNAITTAEKLKKGLEAKGYRFYFKSPTNQQFIIVENEQLKKLAENVVYSYWEAFDDNHTIIRFATSWATKASDVDELIEIL